MISSWVHSLPPLLLFLFYIRLLAEQYEDVEVSTTNAMLLTATCSWFCKRLLEFSSVPFCKNSFSSSSNARLPSSVLEKKIHAISRNSHREMLCKKGVLFCHVSMLWTLVDLFCTKRLFSQETVFSQIILPEVRTGSFSNESRWSRAINKFRTGTLSRILNHSAGTGQL